MNEMKRARSGMTMQRRGRRYAARGEVGLFALAASLLTGCETLGHDWTKCALSGGVYVDYVVLLAGAALLVGLLGALLGALKLRAARPLGWAAIAFGGVVLAFCLFYFVRARIHASNSDLAAHDAEIRGGMIDRANACGRAGGELSMLPGLLGATAILLGKRTRDRDDR